MNLNQDGLQDGPGKGGNEHTGYSGRMCLVRHGETDWNARGLLQGWLDVPLNARGISQAHALAEHLQNRGFNRIWTSPLLRARQTAEIIAEHLGLEVSLHEGLRERHFGELQGQAKADLAMTHPVLMAAIHQRDPAVVFPGGESMEVFAARVGRALNDIQSHASEALLIIAHGWLLDVVTRWQRRLAMNTLLKHKPANAEAMWLDRLNLVNGLNEMNCVNCVNHEQPGCHESGINTCFMPKAVAPGQKLSA